jgi:hypothetical protein
VVLLLALLWLFFTEAATTIWFRLGDARAQDNPVWSINWPTNASSFREARLSKLEYETLRYDSARNVSWQDDSGNKWGLIALRWAPENKHAFIGRGHTPDLCFTGAGWQLCNEPPPLRLQVNSLELPFRCYSFQVGGATAQVFLSLWDERSPGGRQDSPLAYGTGRRLKAVLEAKRHQGLMKLEISMIGPATPEEALPILKEGLEKLIVIEPAGRRAELHEALVK